MKRVRLLLESEYYIKTVKKQFSDVLLTFSTLKSQYCVFLLRPWYSKTFVRWSFVIEFPILWFVCITMTQFENYLAIMVKVQKRKKRKTKKRKTFSRKNSDDAEVSNHTVEK